MFRKDAHDRRRWTSLAALAALLAVCLILLAGVATTADDEGWLARRPALARENPMRPTLLGKEVAPPSAAGPQQAVNPGFTVDLSYNILWGLVDPAQVVTVTRTADGAYGAAEADGVGFFWTRMSQTDGQPADLAGGDVLEVYVDGALVDTISPETVTGGIDVLADQVAGHIANVGAGVPVTVTVGVRGNPPSAGAPQQTATTDASGDWSVTFGDVDLGAETLVAVDYGEAGRYVRTYLYPNDPVFLVQQFRQVAGYSPAIQTVTATVYIAYPGNVRWQATGAARFPHGFYELGKPGEADDAQPGDVVEVEFEDGTLLSTTLFDLGHLSFDTGLDQLSGNAPQGELVRASMWQLAGDEVLYSQALATAAPGDTFQASFAPADLRPRDEVTVAIADGQGHQTQLSSGAPFLDAILDPLSEWDCLQWRVDGPGLPITVSIEIAPGEVYTRENPAGASDAGNGGGCHLVWGPDWGPIDFTPGSTVTLQSPTWQGSVVVADVSWQIDAGNDEINGEAPPGDLEVAVSQWQAGAYPVHGSAAQTGMAASPYSIQFPNFDVRDGGVVAVRHLDPSTGFASNHNAWGPLVTHYFVAYPPFGVGGVAPDADEVVTAWLYDSDGTTLLASTSDDWDDDPWRFWFDLYDYDFYIEPGRWLTVTSESGWAAGLQVPVLTARADPETDLIWGDAPKTQVLVGHQMEQDWAEQWVPVDGYVLDRAFFGGDVELGDDVAVEYQAPIGDRVRMSYLWPRMGVNTGYDHASGVYEIGHTFWLTLTESDGSTVKATATVETTAGGSMHDGGWWDGFIAEGNDWSPSYPDIEPEDWVYYRSDDGYSNAVQAGTITGQMDVDADTAWGTVTVPWFASQTLEGVVGAWAFAWEPITLELDATGMDDYYVDFSPEDLPPGWDIDVKYEEPDLDYVVSEIRSAELYITVSYSRNWVQGDYEAGHTVWLTVTDEFGAIKATVEVETAPFPWGGSGFSTSEYEWDPETPDIAPDDWVYARVDNGYGSTVQVGTITGEMDLEDDTVAGNIYADWFEETLDGQCRAWEEGGPSIDFTVEPDGGSFFCDFGALGWDLQPGNEVAVQYQEPDGDWVMNMFETPWMRVNYGHEWVGGNYPAGHTFWLTVKDEFGAVKATATVQTEGGGGWGGDGFQTQGDDWSPDRPDIQAGDSVQFQSDDGYNNTVEVGEIRGTVDLIDNGISGPIYAEWFAETLEVECHPWGAPQGAPEKYSSAAPDGSAPYTCQWDPDTEWDIQANQDVAVMYTEPDDADRIINVFQGRFQVYLPLALKGH
jgi:hypothetical protein